MPVAVASKVLPVSGGLEFIVELLVSTASKHLHKAALYTLSCAVEGSSEYIFMRNTNFDCVLSCNCCVLLSS